jgi:class 3 adenylate cyclase
LGLLEEREKLNQTSTHRLQVGIGITTGQVVAGGMGSADRLNYTALGERVNLAARLCSHALPGEILIDQATAALLKDELRVESASDDADAEPPGFHVSPPYLRSHSS